MLVSCKAADDTLNQSGNILMFKLKNYQLWSEWAGEKGNETSIISGSEMLHIPSSR